MSEKWTKYQYERFFSVPYEKCGVFLQNSDSKSFQKWNKLLALFVDNTTVPTGPGFRIRIRINLSCWIRIRIRIKIAVPDPDSGGQKWPPKNRKKDRIFIFWSAGCSLLRAEGFSCSLGVLYGGLGIGKLKFLIKKIKIKFLLVSFFQF